MINPYTLTLVILGVFTTVIAQALLKKAAGLQSPSPSWSLYIAFSIIFYGASFFLYSKILKYFDLSKIYPAMTVSQIALVTLYGLAIGEIITGRHILGLIFGIIAIYLILS